MLEPFSPHAALPLPPAKIGAPAGVNVKAFLGAKDKLVGLHGSLALDRATLNEVQA